MATELTEYGKLLESFKKREEQARLSNLSRKEQVSKIYEDIIKRYEPGGAFGAGYEAQLQRQKIGDVGATAQRDIGRGLYGIRPYEAEWEATTGATARLKLEDLRMERLSGAQTGMAGFLERIEEPYPDYSALMAASQAQGGSQVIPRQQPTGGGSSYGQYKPLPTLAGTFGYGGGAAPASTGGGTTGTPGAGVYGISGTSVGNEGDPVMAAATSKYLEAVKAANPGADTSHITADYYAKLLKKTPKNPSRGVWKAYKEAGGSI